MSSIPALRVRGLGKMFHIGATAGSGRLYDRIGSVLKRGGPVLPATEPIIWALRDITFDVPQGSVMAVIGRNGSGKSTLMKIVARVTAPTEGTAEVRGRVGAMLQIGTGFHPELTGRDNIALSGAILGMSRAEVRAAQDAIVDFAEIDRFVDTPVKFYSSGMYMRLAFSVSAHLAAEIMLVDEVLSVGDAPFQEKCKARILDLVGGGRTVLFISHSMSSVRALCDSAIVLDSGRIQYAGDIDSAVDFYQNEVLHGVGAEPDERPR